MTEYKWEPKQPQKMSLDEIICTATLFGVKAGDRYQDHWREVGAPDSIAVGEDTYFHCTYDYSDIMINFTTENNDIF